MVYLFDSVKFGVMYLITKPLTNLGRQMDFISSGVFETAASSARYLSILSFPPLLSFSSLDFSSFPLFSSPPFL